MTWSCFIKKIFYSIFIVFLFFIITFHHRSLLYGRNADIYYAITQCHMYIDFTHSIKHIISYTRLRVRKHTTYASSSTVHLCKEIKKSRRKKRWYTYYLYENEWIDMACVNTEQMKKKKELWNQLRITSPSQWKWINVFLQKKNLLFFLFISSLVSSFSFHSMSIPYYDLVKLIRKKNCAKIAIQILHSPHNQCV